MNLFDPRYREIAVDAEVVAYSTEDSALVRSRVEAALRDFFAFDRMAFGQSVYQSDLIALLDGVRGVSYVHLYAPAEDVLIRPGEIPFGAFNLTSRGPEDDCPFRRTPSGSPPSVYRNKMVGICRTFLLYLAPRSTNSRTGWTRFRPCSTWTTAIRRSCPCWRR